MRFANITFNNSTYASSNIGENMQILAIDNLYDYMGIPREDIVRIDFMKMHEYDGEYVILPINWYFHKFFKYGVQNIFSDRIIPVFLGVSFMSNIFSREEAAFLKKCEPIGCRDEWTFNNLKKMNIDAYLNGCMTSCFKRRIENKDDQNKVFCVDTPKELLEFIPEDIKMNAEFVTQVFDEKIDDIDRFTRNVYDRYKKEAKLVVTSRLHCASPCLAAGIPVIFTIQQCIYTLGWIEKYIPVYTQEQFANIDWQANVVDYEDMKLQILENAKQRVLQVYQENKRIRDISYFFENRKKKEYIIPNVTPVIRLIDKIFKCDEAFVYGFWGITSVSDMIYEYVKDKYPKAKLEKVYDIGYVENHMTYKGLMPELPTSIENDNIFVFVTAYSATEDARRHFANIGKKEDMYCLCCDMKKSF